MAGPNSKEIPRQLLPSPRPSGLGCVIPSDSQSMSFISEDDQDEDSQSVSLFSEDTSEEDLQSVDSGSESPQSEDSELDSDCLVTSVTSRSPAPSRPSMANYICPGCSERGHYQNHCPSRDSLCPTCKCLGHQAIHCKTMTERTQSGDMRFYTKVCPPTPPLPVRERACSGCREKGHNKNSCPHKKSLCEVVP